MDHRERVMQIIKARGPVLPILIAKELGLNTIFAGAILSEIASKKSILISHAKIGGSPVYYIPGQEYKLESLYTNLHEKEKKAFDLLKQKKILRNKELEPVMRVSLQEIKDFAKPLDVSIKEETERFWKWYSLSNNDAENLIKEQLKTEVKEEIKEEKEIKKEPEVKKEVQEPKQIQQKIQQRIELPLKVLEKPKEEKQRFVDKTEPDHFLSRVKDYFEKNNIEVLDQTVVKKNSEIDFVIKIPSNVGSLNYYCKAKSKKRCSDSDLSSALLHGQSMKLPTLFITTGDISKKAQNVLLKELKGMNVKKI